jgi:hypothetical protein
VFSIFLSGGQSLNIRWILRKRILARSNIKYKCHEAGVQSTIQINVSKNRREVLGTFGITGKEQIVKC